MDRNKILDIYEGNLEGHGEDLAMMSTDYREGFYDGAYSFYAALLGEPNG